MINDLTFPRLYFACQDLKQCKKTSKIGCVYNTIPLNTYMLNKILFKMKEIRISGYM